jgi:hypothetical protein
MSFLTEELPKEKKFLLKYFKGESQEKFLRYLIFFGDYKNFNDHTGIVCEEKWLKKLFSKYIDLMYVHDILKKEMDIERLSAVDSGKIKIYSKRKSNYKIKDQIKHI